MNECVDLRKILFVDDEKSVRAVVQLALQDVGGLEVQLCSNGREALQVAEAFRPDLLLLDVVMPGIDGPATLQELRKLEAMQETPAIFMTANTYPDEVAALLQQPNAIAVIAKPFDPMTLADDIRNKLTQHLQC